MGLFWLSAAWLSGIVLAGLLPLPLSAWLLSAAALALAAYLLRTNRATRWALALCCACALGAARAAASPQGPDPGHIASFNDRPAEVRLLGTVIDDPDRRESYTALRVEVDSVALSSEADPLPTHGLVLVYASPLEPWAYGDRVEALGWLETPPTFETFNYRDYLARRGIYSQMRRATVTRLASGGGNPLLRALFAYRRHAHATVQRLFPEPEASLLAGILLGLERGIPPRVRRAFDDTGTSHIIAISGFNITILASVFISLLGRWLGARRGSAAAFAAIGLYTLLVGADAAVVRAAIMGGLALAAQRLGRQADALASLGAAALAMTAVNPAVLWDVGFQLSFAATLGLVLYAPPLQARFVDLASRRLPRASAERLAGPVGEFLLFTLAAQATTLPLTAYYFRRLPLVSPLANVVILPLQPPTMVLGGLATLVGTLSLPLARPLAWLAWPFPALTIRAVEAFAALPAAALPLGQVPLAWVGGYYALLFGLTAAGRQAWWPRVAAHLPRLSAGAALAALAVATGLTWRAYADRPDGLLHLTFLDVGAGEAVLIESPTGRFVLVNGGPSPVALSEGLGRRLPLLAGGVDWLVLGGTADEQVAGLVGLAVRTPPGAALVAAESGGRSYGRVLEELSEAQVPVAAAAPGAALDLGGGAALEVLAVGDHGAVLLARHGRARVLLPVGADPALMADLAAQGRLQPVTALLLPDGGHAAVNRPEWLAALDPQVVVISVQAGDRRGRPSPEVLEALAGRTVLRTDRHGWVELTTDGLRLWAAAERPIGP